LRCVEWRENSQKDEGELGREGLRRVFMCTRVREDGLSTRQNYERVIARRQNTALSQSTATAKD